MLTAIIAAAASCLWVTNCDRGACVHVPVCQGYQPSPQIHVMPQQPAPQSQPGVNYAPLFQPQAPQCRAVTMCDNFGNCRPQTVCD